MLSQWVIKKSFSIPISTAWFRWFGNLNNDQHSKSERMALWSHLCCKNALKSLLYWTRNNWILYAFLEHVFSSCFVFQSPILELSWSFWIAHYVFPIESSIKLSSQLSEAYRIVHISYKLLEISEILIQRNVIVKFCLLQKSFSILITTWLVVVFWKSKYITTNIRKVQEWLFWVVFVAKV